MLLPTENKGFLNTKLCLRVPGCSCGCSCGFGEWAFLQITFSLFTALRFAFVSSQRGLENAKLAPMGCRGSIFCLQEPQRQEKQIMFLTSRNLRQKTTFLGQTTRCLFFHFVGLLLVSLLYWLALGRNTQNDMFGPNMRSRKLRCSPGATKTKQQVV